MNIVLDLCGEVIIDHVLDVLDIETARRDIRGDQDGILAFLELFQDPVALLLLLVAMNAERGPSVQAHLPGQRVAVPLAATEDEDLGAVHDLLEQATQAVPLVPLVDHLHVLPDGVGCAELQGADVDMNRILPADVAREALHLPRPSRAPHERLPVGAALRADLPDLGLKAHVQHAIRLVEAQVGHALQVGVAMIQEVDETARRRDDDLHPFRQVILLLALRHASIAARVLDLGALAEAVALLLDLHRQLPRRRHHKHDRPVALREVWLRVDVHDRRQQEGERLP
mmetsp:Transcript_7805/g.22288  ORF Transcript_7805/g.22288 Transcript_7805/m.22288 type:complete len:285 (-) Transcript_7805:570-1424(-)